MGETRDRGFMCLQRESSYSGLHVCDLSLVCGGNYVALRSSNTLLLFCEVLFENILYLGRNVKLFCSSWCWTKLLDISGEEDVRDFIAFLLTSVDTFGRHE